MGRLHCTQGLMWIWPGSSFSRSAVQMNTSMVFEVELTILLLGVGVDLG